MSEKFLKSDCQEELTVHKEYYGIATSLLQCLHHWRHVGRQSQFDYSGAALNGTPKNG